jgi:hypothetical protein
VTRLNCKRQLTSIILMLSFSCAALGGDSPSVSRAVLHASGVVQVNGVGSREITTLFSGDSIQTTEDSVANIVADGSSVLVMPNALVKFLGQGVELTEGGVSVATSGGMTVSSYGLTFAPPEHTQSKFEVVEYEDSVTVAARQGNVIVNDGEQTSTVPEGQEATHKKRRRAAGAVPAAGGTHSISGTTWALLGGASGATVAGILIATSNNKKKCVSASNNKKCKCKKDKNGKEICEED